MLGENRGGALVRHCGTDDLDTRMIRYFGASIYGAPHVHARSFPISVIKNVRTPAARISARPERPPCSVNPQRGTRAKYAEIYVRRRRPGARQYSCGNLMLDRWDASQVHDDCIHVIVGHVLVKRPRHDH